MNNIDDARPSLPRLHENPRFRPFIRDLLATGDLNDEHINMFTDESGMKEFTRAFTTLGMDKLYNQEFYEILGDSTSNHVVVWYFMRKFPDLFSKPSSGGIMGPVAIMGRLKIVGISKSTYGRYADEWGFWEFIRQTEEDKMQRTKHLEDTFEAFIGCLEFMIDERVLPQSGYSIVYTMMTKLMDRTEVSIKYEDLYDGKTRMNNEKGAFRQLLDVAYPVSEADDYHEKHNGKVLPLGKDVDHLTRFVGNVVIKVDINKIERTIRDVLIKHPTAHSTLVKVIKNLQREYTLEEPVYGVNRKQVETKAADLLLKTGVMVMLQKKLHPLIELMDPPKAKIAHMR